MSWRESEHGSLPSLHQRRLQDSDADQCITNASALSPVIPVQLPHPAAVGNVLCNANVLRSVFGAKYHQTRERGTPSIDISTVHGEAHNVGSEDSTSSSDDELGEADDNINASCESSHLTPPHVVEFRGCHTIEEDTLSSIFDLSLSGTFAEDDEAGSSTRTRTNEGDADTVKVEGNASSLLVEENNGVALPIKSPDKKDNRTNIDLTATYDQVSAPVSELAMPGPKKSSRQEVKGVSFPNTEQNRFQRASKMPGPVVKTKPAENTTKREKTRRYMPSSCSVNAVLPSFMSPTRASMAKSRPRGLREGNVGSDRKHTRNAKREKSQKREKTNERRREPLKVDVFVVNGTKNRRVTNTVDAIKRTEVGRSQRKLRELQPNRG